ncbi:Lcl C-terminal domain-containing protein [Thermophagus sp. OGC60D27]|uniref:Lcl C-terminal domain-containing protein n=1 Tax=Thermophagus sp. OGC60D27 TaxID=3458415 RepID=UPI0040377F36
MKRYELISAGVILITIMSMAICSCEDNENTIDAEQAEAPTVNNYLLTATGQTSLYDNDGNEISHLNEGDALYGQDANYMKGAEMAYKDNGDGTITDLNTGLMWQSIPDSEDFTWDEAVEYCENLELGGYDDWRLPSCKELYSISDFSSGWPYLNTTYFKLAGEGVTKDEQYWSSDKYVGITVEGQDNAAFGVNHVTGHIKAYPAGDSGFGTMETGTPPPPAGEGAEMPMGNPFGKQVRAVRGDNYGINDFTDNGDGTITDNSTGLMWAQNDSGEAMDWEDALAYAENSDLAGYTDWRLPNVKELQSIVDYSYSPSATDASKVGPAIDPVFSCTPITNEAGDSDYGYYWTGTSAHFTSGEPYYYAWYVAFGRAVNGEGLDFHGAGGVRFDTKYEGGPLGEGGERYYNYVRLVRDAK